MNAPTLSVLMPNYNHALFMRDALEAMLEQSYRPLEIIIFDDGSTDNSLDVIEQYRSRDPDLIRVVGHQHNRGGLYGASQLLSMARGDFVFFSAMDDHILPGFLGRSMALLEQFPDAGISSTLSYMMDISGEMRGLVRMPIVLQREGFIGAPQVLHKLRQHGNWVQGNTTIYRRAALLAEGGFNESLGPYADGFLYLVLALKHGACFIPEPLAVWRRMPNSYSSRSSNDIDMFLGVLDHAERLMRTQYAQLFPLDYIGKWKREMYFGVASRAAMDPRSEWIADVRRLVPATTTIDDWFDVTVRLWPNAARKLAKPYLYGKLKHREFLRMVQRRVRHRLIA